MGNLTFLWLWICMCWSWIKWNRLAAIDYREVPGFGNFWCNSDTHMAQAPCWSCVWVHCTPVPKHFATSVVMQLHTKRIQFLDPSSTAISNEKCLTIWIWIKTSVLSVLHSKSERIVMLKSNGSHESPSPQPFYRGIPGCAASAVNKSCMILCVCVCHSWML